MGDPYAGQAGQFVTDPETGTRKPLAQWQQEQQETQDLAIKKAKSSEKPKKEE